MQRAYGVTRRRFEVIKLRGSDYREGFHDYIIQKGGLQVFPRLVANEHETPFDGERVSSHVAALDRMFGGGIHRGSSTLLIGPSGCGKSSLAMQFAYAAATTGNRASVYVFDEVLRTAQERAEGLGMAVRAQIGKGTLAMSQIDPAGLSPGAFAWEIRREVEKKSNTRVVVIDSLNGFMMAMPGEHDLNLHLHELLAFLNQKGVVTFLIHTQHGLVGGMQTDIDVSYLSDTVVLLRYFEAGGDIRQVLSVLKQRLGLHERTLREIRLTNKGIEIGEPLTKLHGVLTGEPNLIEPLRATGHEHSVRGSINEFSSPGDCANRPGRRADYRSPASEWSGRRGLQ